MCLRFRVVQALVCYNVRRFDFGLAVREKNLYAWFRRIQLSSHELAEPGAFALDLRTSCELASQGYCSNEPAACTFRSP